MPIRPRHFSRREMCPAAPCRLRIRPLRGRIPPRTRRAPRGLLIISRAMPAASFESLKAFFETAPAARRAARPLSRDARVNLALEGGPATFTMESGAPEVRAGAAQDPDFTLTMPPGAVSRITGLASDDVGEFGIEFFKLVLERDPSLKVRVRMDAPTTRLLGHGYLGVLAAGGLRVTWWLLKNGVKNPKSAIERLRGVR